MNVCRYYTVALPMLLVFFAACGSESGDPLLNETEICYCDDGRPGARYFMENDQWSPCDCGPVGTVPGADMVAAADTTAPQPDTSVDTAPGVDTAPETSPPVPCTEGWLDEATGLCWYPPGNTDFTSFSAASSICENLTAGGADDWLLPTISEVRTLIQGCAPLMTGGECGVTDECASYPECIGMDCSWAEEAGGECHMCKLPYGLCPYQEGPGTSGGYFPSGLTEWDMYFYLMSRTEPANEPSKIWAANLGIPSIFALDKVQNNPNTAYKCVRKVD